MSEIIITLIMIGPFYWIAIKAIWDTGVVQDKIKGWLS